MQRSRRDGREVGLDEDVVDRFGQLAGHRRGDRLDVLAGDQRAPGGRKGTATGDAQPLGLAQHRGERVTEAGRVAHRSPPPQPGEQRFGGGDLSGRETGQLREHVAAHSPHGRPVQVGEGVRR